MFQELSTAIIGIGALFFAFSEVSALPFIKLTIAAIGLGGSIVLWYHIYASNKDGKYLTIELDTFDPSLYDHFHDFKVWRHQEKSARWFYFPAGDSAGYFMEMVGVFWVLIIIYSIRESIIALMKVYFNFSSQ